MSRTKVRVNPFAVKDDDKVEEVFEALRFEAEDSGVPAVLRYGVLLVKALPQGGKMTGTTVSTRMLK